MYGTSDPATQGDILLPPGIVGNSNVRTQKRGPQLLGPQNSDIVSVPPVSTVPTTGVNINPPSQIDQDQSAYDAALKSLDDSPTPQYNEPQYEKPKAAGEIIGGLLNVLFPGSPIATMAAGFMGGQQQGAQDQYARAQAAAQAQYKAAQDARQAQLQKVEIQGDRLSADVAAKERQDADELKRVELQNQADWHVATLAQQKQIADDKLNYNRQWKAADLAFKYKNLFTNRDLKIFANETARQNAQTMSRRTDFYGQIGMNRNRITADDNIRTTNAQIYIANMRAISSQQNVAAQQAGANYRTGVTQAGANSRARMTQAEIDYRTLLENDGKLIDEAYKIAATAGDSNPMANTAVKAALDKFDADKASGKDSATGKDTGMTGAQFETIHPQLGQLSDAAQAAISQGPQYEPPVTDANGNIVSIGGSSWGGGGTETSGGGVPQVIINNQIPPGQQQPPPGQTDHTQPRDPNVSLGHTPEGTSLDDGSTPLDPNAGVNEALLDRINLVEFGDGKNFVSSEGAKGPFQFTDDTAKRYHVNVYDYNSSRDGARRYLTDLRAQFGGDMRAAIAAYNAGPQTVMQAQAQHGADWGKYVPKETQNYITRVFGSSDERFADVKYPQPKADDNSKKPPAPAGKSPQEVQAIIPQAVEFLGKKSDSEIADALVHKLGFSQQQAQHILKTAHAQAKPPAAPAPAANPAATPNLAQQQGRQVGGGAPPSGPALEAPPQAPPDAASAAIEGAAGSAPSYGGQTAAVQPPKSPGINPVQAITNYVNAPPPKGTYNPPSPAEKAPPVQTPSAQALQAQKMQQALPWAVRLIQSSSPPQQIMRMLEGRGLTPDSARQVIQQAIKASQSPPQPAGAW